MARGQLREDEYFYTGLVNGKEQDALPFAATLPVLERGQERFNVYCTPCHSRVGNGAGHDRRARLQAGGELSRRKAPGAAAQPLLLSS